MLRGNIKCLPCPSPVRQILDTMHHKITSGEEDGQNWKTFQKESQATSQEKITSDLCFLEEKSGERKSGHEYENITSDGKYGRDWETFESEFNKSRIRTEKSTKALGASSSQYGSVYDVKQITEENYSDRDFLTTNSSDQEKSRLCCYPFFRCVQSIVQSTIDAFRENKLYCTGLICCCLCFGIFEQICLCGCLRGCECTVGNCHCNCNDTCA